MEENGEEGDKSSADLRIAFSPLTGEREKEENVHAPGRRKRGPKGCDAGGSWFQRELKKRNLMEVYEPGRGRRNCGLYRMTDNEPRSVSPEGEDKRWWKMNQPRHGPDFLVDPTTHDFFEFQDMGGGWGGDGVKGRGRVCGRERGRSDERRSTSAQQEKQGGKRKGRAPSLVPELCDFHVGDRVLAAADGEWLISTVLKVEEKRCSVKIREDTARFIEYTPGHLLPEKPEDGHRLLNCTVHLDMLPSPWIGTFVIDVTEEWGKTAKGDWIFRCGEHGGEQRIHHKTKPCDRDLAFLHGGALCVSGARKQMVDDAVKRAVETAERMYPFIRHGSEGYCPDIAVPADIDEKYGGESCFRCGDVGLLCVCSECADKNAVCETVVCFECLDRPADRHKYDPDIGGHQDWFCDRCRTAMFNRNRQRKSVVKAQILKKFSLSRVSVHSQRTKALTFENVGKLDEHVKYVRHQFNVEDPSFDFQEGMHGTSFELAAIDDMPKNYAIGLIVGPSGTGKTLLLKSRFGYDDALWDCEWNDDLAVISQVHADPEEALARLTAMGISSEPDMCRPFKDLSVGQQDCAKMARALGHGAVFDEFGSTLGPLGVLKLCKGMRRFVRDRGLGNLVVATCNTQVVSMLKPDWVITTGLGTSKVNFKSYEPGYWGPDEKHRVEGALDAVSSKLLASGRADLSWTQEEVENLKTQYRRFEQETLRKEEEVQATAVAAACAALKADQARLATQLRNEFDKQEVLAQQLSETKGRQTAVSERAGGGDAASGQQEDEDDEMVPVEVRRESCNKEHVRGSAEGGRESHESRGAAEGPAKAREVAGSAETSDSEKTVTEDLRRSTMRVREIQERLKRIQEQIKSRVTTTCERDSDAQAHDARAGGQGTGGKGGVLLDLDALLDLQFMPRPLASSLRIQIRSADRSVWPLFMVAHYKGSQQLNAGAHVYIATLPDHGNGPSLLLSLTLTLLSHMSCPASVRSPLNDENRLRPTKPNLVARAHSHAKHALSHTHTHTHTHARTHTHTHTHTHTTVPVGVVAVLSQPGIGNKIGTRTHRGFWREHRTVVLPSYQGCGIGPAIGDAVAAAYWAMGCNYSSAFHHPIVNKSRINSMEWECRTKKFLPAAWNTHGHMSRADEAAAASQYKSQRAKADEHGKIFVSSYVVCI